MPPRRPDAHLDPERLMKRVEDRIDQALDALLREIGTIKLEVRKGNMETELLTRRMTDLENQVIETRSHIQISEREGVNTAKAVAAEAASAAHAAPKKVWRTWIGLITAGSAAFVAIVAFFNNLPRFVRGAADVSVSLFHYIVSRR